MKLGLFARVFALALVACAFLTHSAQAAITFGDSSPTKSNAATDFIPGTGIPENQFTIDTAGTGEQVFLKARNRVSGVPLSQTGNIYSVLSGMATATRAAWNFDFQFTPLAGKVGGDYLFEILADTNPAFGAASFVTVSVPSSVTLAAAMGDSYYPNGSGGTIGGTDASPTYSYSAGWSSATTPFVVGNSQNYNFAHLAGAGFTNPGNAEYEIRAVMKDSLGATLATSTVLVQVVPEPATLSVLALSALALVARRRRV